jgi:hypothetical protein
MGISLFECARFEIYNSLNRIRMRVIVKKLDTRARRVRIRDSAVRQVGTGFEIEA